MPCVFIKKDGETYGKRFRRKWSGKRISTEGRWPDVYKRQVFMLVSYLSMVQYEKLYTETVSSKQLALEQLTQNIQNSLATVETLSQNLAYRSPISSLISRNNLENFPIWTKRSSNEIIDALHYTLTVSYTHLVLIFKIAIT